MTFKELFQQKTDLTISFLPQLTVGDMVTGTVKNCIANINQSFIKHEAVGTAKEAVTVWLKDHADRIKQLSDLYPNSGDFDVEYANYRMTVVPLLEDLNKAIQAVELRERTGTIARFNEFFFKNSEGNKVLLPDVKIAQTFLTSELHNEVLNGSKTFAQAVKDYLATESLKLVKGDVNHELEQNMETLTYCISRSCIRVVSKPYKVPNPARTGPKTDDQASA